MAEGKTRPISSGFIGTGWSFPPAFSTNQCGALLVSQVHDIEESLRILLATTPGERVMQPSYGCGLQRMVFETLNESSLTELRSTIEKAVLFFEARITLDEVSFDTEDTVLGVLHIHLHYTVRTTNSRYNMVYPLYLQEGRGARGALT